MMMVIIYHDDLQFHAAATDEWTHLDATAD